MAQLNWWERGAPDYKDQQEKYLALIQKLVDSGRIADREELDQYVQNIQTGKFEIPGPKRRGTGKFERRTVQTGTEQKPTLEMMMAKPSDIFRRQQEVPITEKGKVAAYQAQAPAEVLDYGPGFVGPLGREQQILRGKTMAELPNTEMVNQRQPTMEDMRIPETGNLRGRSRFAVPRELGSETVPTMETRRTEITEPIPLSGGGNELIPSWRYVQSKDGKWDVEYAKNETGEPIMSTPGRSFLGRFPYPTEKGNGGGARMSMAERDDWKKITDYHAQRKKYLKGMIDDSEFMQYEDEYKELSEKYGLNFKEVQKMADELDKDTFMSRIRKKVAEFKNNVFTSKKPSEPAPAGKGTPVYAENKKTGKRVVSYDNGQTWQPAP